MVSPLPHQSISQNFGYSFILGGITRKQNFDLLFGYKHFQFHSFHQPNKKTKELELDLRSDPIFHFHFLSMILELE